MQLLAIMVIHPNAEEAKALKRFCTEACFEELGVLKKVGKKFDQ